MTQQADLKLTKTADRAEATGGQTISYTVGVTDLGPGPARSIEVTDTLPDGTIQRRTLPDLAERRDHDHARSATRCRARSPTGP